MIDRAGVEVDERRTARLLLRRPLAADLEWMTAMHADPANYPHRRDGAHSAIGARAIAESSIGQWQRDGIGYWMVLLEDTPVGMAGISPMSFCARPCLNLYYRFVPSARGQGLAGEVCREALTVAAEIASEHPVVVRTRPDNEPARRLAVSIGLERRADLDTADGFVVYVSRW